MRLFYKTQDEQIKNIIMNVFRSGDYAITVHYGKKNNMIFHDKHLADVISRLEKGYQKKNKGLIFVGATDATAVRLVVNGDITLIELIELLWEDMDCIQINILVTTSKEGIRLAAEDMLKDTRKYIVVSEIAGKISRLWQEAPAGA
ncbi:MAG: hypothetical protein K1W19_12770 [Lachnospiraceae bacterium]